MSRAQERKRRAVRRRANRAITGPLLAATFLLAGSACASDDDEDDASTVADSSPVLLDERFDDDTNGWGGTFQSFDAGEYLWALPAGQTDARAADSLISIESEIDAVQVTMGFVAEGAGHVGIDCAVADVDGQADFYEVLLTDRGVAIRKSSFGDVLAVTLAEASEPVLVDGADTEFTATCVRSADTYVLRLAIDGEEVLAATDDDPLGPGAPGILAGALPRDRSPDGATIRFSSYLVHDVGGET